MKKYTSEQAWAMLQQNEELRFYAPKTSMFCAEILEWVDGEPVEVVLGKTGTFAYDIGSCYKRDDWTVKQEEEKEIA